MDSVRKIFDGDNNLELAQRQYNRHNHTIDIISGICTNRYLVALNIIDEYTPVAGTMREKIIDMPWSYSKYRILLDVHDLIAGYWRWKSGYCHPFIPGLREDPMEEWKKWLYDEVKVWAHDDATIVRYVVLALTDQGADDYYEEVYGTCASKDVLLMLLIGRYKNSCIEEINEETGDIDYKYFPLLKGVFKHS